MYWLAKGTDGVGACSHSSNRSSIRLRHSGTRKGDGRDSTQKSAYSQSADALPLHHLFPLLQIQSSWTTSLRHLSRHWSSVQIAAHPSHPTRPICAFPVCATRSTSPKAFLSRRRSTIAEIANGTSTHHSRGSMHSLKAENCLPSASKS